MRFPLFVSLLTMFAFVFPGQGSQSVGDGRLRAILPSFARLSTRPLALSVTTSGEWWPRAGRGSFPNRQYPAGHAHRRDCRLASLARKRGGSPLASPAIAWVSIRPGRRRGDRVPKTQCLWSGYALLLIQGKPSPWAQEPWRNSGPRRRGHSGGVRRGGPGRGRRAGQFQRRQPDRHRGPQELPSRKTCHARRGAKAGGGIAGLPLPFSSIRPAADKLGALRRDPGAGNSGHQ